MECPGLHPHPVAVPFTRLDRTRSAAWHTELPLFVAAYLIYDAARWLFAGESGTAEQHARWIVELERSAHAAFEGSVQRALGVGAPGWVLSNVYLAAQLVVLPLALVCLYRRSRPVYRRLRDTVLGSWLIAVPIFALFPVAPPRLAGIGIADTVTHHAAFALTGHSTIFYNQFAAVPSLHVGFASAIGIAAAAALRRRWAKALALLWGPVVALSVLATGNHYVVDIVAGLVVTAAAYMAGRVAGPRSHPHPQEVTI
jgi:membrane-associated phospholipid phosphatase